MVRERDWAEDFLRRTLFITKCADFCTENFRDWRIVSKNLGSIQIFARCGYGARSVFGILWR